MESELSNLKSASAKSFQLPWTRDIRHGELIRDGYDETLTIDSNFLQMLSQGRWEALIL